MSSNVKGLVSAWLLLGLWSAAAQGAAAEKPLPAPRNLTVTVEDSVPEFSWQAVTGAACYRLAVFPGLDKNAAPLGAVWIKGTRFRWGQDAFILKIGGLPSKTPGSLQKDEIYKWMVAAAAPGGLRKSDWSSSRFQFSDTAKPNPTASATPTPMGGELTVSPESDTSTAKTEVKTEGPTPTVTATPEVDNVLKESSSEEPSMAKAQQLLKDRKWEPAQKEFRRLCDQDPRSFDAWAGLGDAYLGSEMRVEAVEAYRQALTIKDDEKIRAWMKQNVRER
jgi:hypothetical protein